MNVNDGVRQTHRWVAIAFTVGVVVNIVALARLDKSHPAAPPFWVGLLALLPLVVLELTGLYLFALPYVSKRRGGTTAGHVADGRKAT